jgi:hypothetical protein
MFRDPVHVHPQLKRGLPSSPFYPSSGASPIQQFAKVMHHLEMKGCGPDGAKHLEEHGCGRESTTACLEEKGHCTADAASQMHFQNAITHLEGKKSGPSTAGPPVRPAVQGASPTDLSTTDPSLPQGDKHAFMWSSIALGTPLKCYAVSLVFFRHNASKFQAARRKIAPFAPPPPPISGGDPFLPPSGGDPIGHHVSLPQAPGAKAASFSGQQNKKVQKMQPRSLLSDLAKDGI